MDESQPMSVDNAATADAASHPPSNALSAPPVTLAALRQHHYSNLLQQYFTLLQHAADQQDSDCRAATLIQRHWHGYRTRKWLQQCHAAATLLQCHWRGVLSRHRVIQLQAYQQLQHHTHYYNYMATKIQAVYRGFHTRQHMCNIAKRHEYLQQLHVRSQQLIEEEVPQYQHATNNYRTYVKNTRHEANLYNTLQHQHYLLSTSNQRGVYNHPFKGLITAEHDSQPMEQHLENAYMQRSDRYTTKLGQSLKQQQPTLNNSKKGTSTNKSNKLPRIRPADAINTATSFNGAKLQTIKLQGNETATHNKVTLPQIVQRKQIET